MAQSQTSSRSRARSAIAQLTAEFEAIVEREVRPTEDFEAAAESLAAHICGRKWIPLAQRRRSFFAHVNWKFRLNSSRIQRLLTDAATAGITFHYHQKRAIQAAFDASDRLALSRVLQSKAVPLEVRRMVLGDFAPITESETIKHLHGECTDPAKLRRARGDRDIEREILQALFASFIFEVLPSREMHHFFDPHFQDVDYRESFWEQLQLREPQLFNRGHALSIMRIDSGRVGSPSDFISLREEVTSFVKSEFDRLNNHCVLAILVEPLVFNGRCYHWELVGDLTLFAEKHIYTDLRKAYFRPTVIEQDSLSYIPGVDVAKARFDLANEGFTYRDTFAVSASEASAESDVTAVLLLEKNERDETLIQCPACRSDNVHGNSYPSLGVRSWECRNPLCPDRSKYNRGKRYSFKGLMTQQAIEDDRHLISRESVRRWARDVQANCGSDDALRMLVEHYSLWGDVVHTVDCPPIPVDGRQYVTADWPTSNGRVFSDFEASPLFDRFVIDAGRTRADNVRNLGSDDFRVYCGDAGQVLGEFEGDVFDGAVTSPPYYNAREYSQWKNIYCYLFDIYRINREVFRCLRPGAPYLFNIFDYFDNERSVVFSAMGKKRMILSAYTIDLFRRIGFECIGNVVWDKGDIEGKRGFNAGNFSPYYQSPFNCWEHILVFRKPCDKPVGSPIQALPGVLRAKPVFKMVNGENKHGHTAPFPDDLPRLLLSLLKPKSHVLDPFAGSLTTGRVAEALGYRSTCIELHPDYCQLGLALRERAAGQLSLTFATS